MRINLRYILCLSALLSSGLIYLGFGAYMSVAAGYDMTVMYAAFLAVVIFGILSWLQLMMPRTGSLLLILASLWMVLLWPGWLWENDQLIWWLLTVPVLATLVLALFTWNTPVPVGKVKWVIALLAFLLAATQSPLLWNILSHQI